MKRQISQLKSKYRYALILLRELVITDFKLRYQNSTLGYLWSLLKPFSLFVIMYIVFVKILPAGGDIPHFGTYLLLGIVLWNYFTEVTNSSVAAIVNKGDLLRKVNFPRYVIILAGSFAAMINLILNLIVVGFFMIVFGTEVSGTAILFPLLIVELFVFALGLAFLLSALYVKFRDINYIWEVSMQAAFFATPIMYAFSLVSDKSEIAAKLLISNPVAQLMQDARYMLISTKTTTIDQVFGSQAARLIPIGIVVFVAIIAAVYFRRRSASFAEQV